MAEDKTEAGGSNAPASDKKRPRKSESADKSKQAATKSREENVESKSPAQDAAAVTVSPAAQPARSGNGIGWGAIVLSVLALGAAAYAWYQTAVNARLAGGEQNNRLQIMEQRLDDVGSSQSGVDSLVEQIRQRVADTQTGVADQVSQLRQLVSNTESALLGQISEVKQQVAGSETQLSGQIQELRAQSDSGRQQLQASLVEAGAALDARNDAFRQEFNTLAANIDALQAELGTSVQGWSMREVEHLLVLANQRAQLGQDARGARTALRLADQRLEQLGDPSLTAVRENLSQEIAALDAVQPIDYAGVTNTLSLLSRTLEDLPMRGVTSISGPTAPTGADAGGDEAAEASSTGDQILSIGKTFLADLGDLVQVEKGGEPVVPPLSPEIRQMIMERGKLILEGAQVAMMRQQPEIFQDRLETAESWIRERYDDGNDQTLRWLEQLAALKDVNPKMEMPDISASLDTLRGLMNTGA